jgi:dipeptidyl aminopeptidase/acylaminoacyl peptidase
VRLPIAIMLLLAVALLPVAAQTRTFAIADVRTIVDISSPKLSPDGRSVVCVVTRADYADNDYDSEIVLVSVASGAQRVLTQDRDDVSSAQWSPAGDRIAFIARDGAGDDARDQLFVMPMNGGDARKITDAPNGVDVFSWRPDGAAIAYVSAAEPPNKDAIARGHDYFEVGNDAYLTTAAPTPLHLWLVPSQGGTARQLTSGSWSIAEPDVSVPLSWSPDGRDIALTRVPTAHTGDADHSTIVILDTATLRLRPLTTHKRYEDFASFSPDGSTIAFWRTTHDRLVNESNVFVAPRSGGDGRNIMQAIDRDVYGSLWMPDSKSMLIAAPDATRVSLWLQPLEGAARKIDLGDLNLSVPEYAELSVGKDGAIAFTGDGPKRPTELYYMSSISAAPRRLTDFNRPVAALDLGATQSIEWKTFDGFRDDGVITYPPGYVRGKKYPLVVRIHGGPNEGSSTSFWDYIQLVAAHGYIVFQPNYRGSDNLGDAFETANWNDEGVGPGRDVMAGIAAVERLGIVDSSRIAVGGWSQGGFMSAWLIGHYSIWKAAVLGAAFMDAVEDYDLSDSNVADGPYWSGSPWVADHMRDYLVQSAITYWKNIKTPTLILSNTGDVRVPITQSYAMYHALTDNHVPVKLVAWPESGHEVSGPVRTDDMYRIWLDWLDHYLK